MSITIFSDAAAVRQPKKHKTAKQAVNAGVTGAALYGLYHVTGDIFEPFAYAALSGKDIKAPTGKYSSKIHNFFNKLGEKLASEESVKKLAKEYVDKKQLKSPEDLLKSVNKFKGARGAVAVLAVTGLAALTTLVLGICNACRINKQ